MAGRANQTGDGFIKGLPGAPCNEDLSGDGLADREAGSRRWGSPTATDAASAAGEVLTKTCEASRIFGGARVPGEIGESENQDGAWRDEARLFGDGVVGSFCVGGQRT